jgi:aspartate-semialdehyde dehydrogenase
MKVAIIGATGAVGREMIVDLEESSVADIELGAFASARSAGEKIRFRGKEIVVQEYSPTALQDYPYILMSAGGSFSKANSPTLVEQGSLVIDNSSAWRMDSGVQLIVPEVNGQKIKGMKKGIIANPNCSTIQMVVALKPLKDSFGIKSVNVCTYQSVSGTGQTGITELSEQLNQQLKFQDLKANVYAQPIAFNLLPAIDRLDDDHHCFEEVKMVEETRKIFNMPDLPVMASTVRVPTFNCHGEMITVELAEEVTRSMAVEAMSEGEGLTVDTLNDHQKFPTPRSATGERGVFVSRIRVPYGQEKSSWVQFWNVADNLKKGAATNAVQILELATQP